MTVYERITAILKNRGVDTENIDKDADFITSGIMDSMAFVNMLLEIENELGIEIDFANMDMGKIGSLNALAAYAESLTA
ncbi:MAG: acyl carrier protein [Mucispirillum sp.]|nr:acyl carrier protein [Mucispirillum sp.]